MLITTAIAAARRIARRAVFCRRINEEMDAKTTGDHQAITARRRESSPLNKSGQHQDAERDHWATCEDMIENPTNHRRSPGGYWGLAAAPARNACVSK